MIRSAAYAIAQNPKLLWIMEAGLCLRHSCRIKQGQNGTFLLSKKNRQIRIARKHLMYASGTAEHFDLLFSQVKPRMIGEMLEVDYSGPKLQTLSNGQAFEISSFPEEFASIEAYFAEFTPSPGDLVFDVGAYCGVFTAKLSEVVGSSGRVIAFEPDPLNFTLLERNVARHALNNVTLVNAAVSGRTGTAQFNPEGANGSALSTAISRPSVSGHTEVATLTLEDTCARYGVPSFIKIDAEGAELEILGAAGDFIRSHPIHFALDTCHIREGKLTATRVENIFRSIGYEVHTSRVAGYETTWATPPKAQS